MERRSLIRAAFLAFSLLLTSCNQDAQPNSVSGTIETDEARLASRYGGRVEQIFAQEGDSLTNGQLVAELNASELHARREAAAAQLADLEAGPRKEEIAAAKADWEAQVANLELARADASRAENLFAQKTLSVTERDRDVTRMQSLEKIVAADKSRYDLLLAGTRPEQIEQARAQVAQIDAQLAEMKIVSPTNCVLEVLSVKIGDVLAPNQPVATVLLPEHIWVRVYVPEQWLARIKVGESANVRVDGFLGKEFSGVIEQINRSAEFTPRNVQTVGERVKQMFGVKVRLDNSSGNLRAGLSADVRFLDAMK